MRVIFEMPTGSSLGDKLARAHGTSQASMLHFFELGYADGQYGNYRRESVKAINMNPAHEYAYDMGFDVGKKRSNN